MAIAESAEGVAKAKNKVYVAMAYIGMLRRAPDAGGFNFWLNHMNNGASETDIINGFYLSGEYWNRFMP